MPFENLSQWLAWLESFNVLRSKQKTFSSVIKIAKRLKLLPHVKKTIIVAGSNGKGSCVALLEAIYCQAGYRVASFTSPHLLSFNERIRVQGNPVDDNLICDAFSKINLARDKVLLSYFQFAFLAALWVFKKREVDLTIFEVGVGGECDVVNILDGDLGIISSIDLDHCELLGRTRQAIAKEKAGIMRRGKMVICGDDSPPSTLFSMAKEKGAKLYCIGSDFNYYSDSLKWSWICQNKILKNLFVPNILLSNAATVLMAVFCLQEKIPVLDKAIYEGLKKFFSLGRCQVLQLNGVNVLLDVAHNPAAAKVLSRKVQSEPIKGRKYAVVGIRDSKDIIEILKCIYHLIDDWFITNLDCHDGKTAEKLFLELDKLGVRCKRCYTEPLLAFRDALHKAKPEDLVIVFGSFLTVADVIKKEV